MNWSEIAPTRADKMVLSAKFENAGFGHTTWENGIPRWARQPGDAKIEEIVFGGKKGKKSKK